MHRPRSARPDKFRPTVDRSTVVRATLCVSAFALVLAGCASDTTDADGATDTTVDSSSTTEAAPSDTAGDAQGSIDELEPTAPAVEVLDPVPFDQSVEFGNGVSASITGIEAIEAKSELPGERSGAAVKVTVEVTNDSADEISLDEVTVDLRDADDLPAYVITTDPAAPFSGSLEPGSTATAAYVFTLAPESRSDALLTIQYSTDAPIVAFTGNLPNE